MRVRRSSVKTRSWVYVEDGDTVSAHLHAKFVFLLEVAELALPSVSPELCVLSIVSELCVLMLVSSVKAVSLILLQGVTSLISVLYKVSQSSSTIHRQDLHWGRKEWIQELSSN